MSVLSEKEMEQLYGSLKKLGLLAAERLNQQQAKVRLPGPQQINVILPSANW